MMLVSSSGCAHSPSTLILTDLSAVYGAAFATGAPARMTATAIATTTPKRFTSSLPPRSEWPSHSHLFTQLRTAKRSYVIPAFNALSSRVATLGTSASPRCPRCPCRRARRPRERERDTAVDRQARARDRALRARARDVGDVAG